MGLLQLLVVIKGNIKTSASGSIILFHEKPVKRAACVDLHSLASLPPITNGELKLADFHLVFEEKEMIYSKN